MSTNHHLMDAIDRLSAVESAIYGNPAENMKGLFERVNAHEAFIKRWDQRFEKIFVAIIIGAIGALGSLGLLIKILMEVKSH